MIRPPARILVVDDSVDVRAWLTRVLGDEGFEARTAANGREALGLIQEEAFDLVLLDIRMPGLDGIEVLRRAKALDRGLLVLMITVEGSVAQVMAATRAGANDYLVKPLTREALLGAVRQALSAGTLRQGARQSGRGKLASLQEEMGSSEAVARISASIARVAQTEFSVLILGETGTGKDLVARAIHQASPRAAGPFIPVDCGAIPETLFESEVFGHERGAFTSADRAVPGKFEAAHGGTLFLDEICNTPIGSQAKLLRASQEHYVNRVGSTKLLKIDCRLIVAGNEDLEARVAAGRFRNDLYFRLSEFVIHVPPLRKRKEDIAFLTKRFLDLTNEELGKNIQRVSDLAMERLLTFTWPGNVRQLRSTIRRAVLMADTVINEEHLGLPRAPYATTGEGAEPLGKADVPLKQLVRQATGTIERMAILQALRQANGNKAEAARLLHIDYKTMYSKLKAYGLVTSEEGEHGKEET